MSENNNINEFDLMMKSILDEAREEVPGRVWEGVSSGLAKAARRKAAVLWWKRSAIGAAAAAAVILGVFLTPEDDFVPETAGDNELIAVVKPEETEADSTEVILMAEVRNIKPETIIRQNVTEAADKTDKVSGYIETKVTERSEEEAETSEEVSERAESGDVSEKAETPKKIQEHVPANEYFPEDWDYDEGKKRRRNVSITLAGVAGTNNALSQNKLRPMMRPQAAPAPQKSGISETSVKSSYGIPLSFGAGVKFDLSPRWSIGTGVNYTFLSRQFYGKYTQVNEEGMIENVVFSDISNRQHYIGIPVNAFFDIINNDRINFYAYAGGTVEKCVANNYRVLKTPISHREKVAGVQLSANAGIGVEFMLGKHLGLYIDPSVRYYFNNDQPKSIRTVQPFMLGFEMGFRARL